MNEEKGGNLSRENVDGTGAEQKKLDNPFLNGLIVMELRYLSDPILAKASVKHEEKVHIPAQVH